MLQIRYDTVIYRHVQSDATKAVCVPMGVHTAPPLHEALVEPFHTEALQAALQSVAVL